MRGTVYELALFIIRNGSNRQKNDDLTVFFKNGSNRQKNDDLSHFFKTRSNRHFLTI